MATREAEAKFTNANKDGNNRKQVFFRSVMDVFILLDSPLAKL